MKQFYNIHSLIKRPCNSKPNSIYNKIMSMVAKCVFRVIFDIYQIYPNINLFETCLKVENLYWVVSVVGKTYILNQTVLF